MSNHSKPTQHIYFMSIPKSGFLFVISYRIMHGYSTPRFHPHAHHTSLCSQQLVNMSKTNDLDELGTYWHDHTYILTWSNLTLVNFVHCHVTTIWPCLEKFHWWTCTLSYDPNLWPCPDQWHWWTLYTVMWPQFDLAKNNDLRQLVTLSYDPNLTLPRQLTLVNLVHCHMTQIWPCQDQWRDKFYTVMWSKFELVLTNDLGELVHCPQFDLAKTNDILIKFYIVQVTELDLAVTNDLKFYIVMRPQFDLAKTNDLAEHCTLSCDPNLTLSRPLNLANCLHCHMQNVTLRLKTNDLGLGTIKETR